MLVALISIVSPQHLQHWRCARSLALRSPTLEIRPLLEAFASTFPVLGVRSFIEGLVVWAKSETCPSRVRGTRYWMHSEARAMCTLGLYRYGDQSRSLNFLISRCYVYLSSIEFAWSIHIDQEVIDTVMIPWKVTPYMCFGHTLFHETEWRDRNLLG